MDTLPTLNTLHVIEQIKDRLDEFVVLGMYPDALRQKAIAPTNMLSRINNADIEVCGMLRPSAQMVCRVLAGQTEVSLATDEVSNNPMSDSEALSRVLPTDNEGNFFAGLLFLDREWYLDASTLRGDFIRVYSKFPSGDAQPINVLKVQTLQSFEDLPEYDNYEDHVYGERARVYVEQSTKRLRLSHGFDDTVFLSWEAYVLPNKINPASESDISKYPIRTPAYAEDYLVLTALAKSLTIGSELRANVMAEADNERRKALDRMPSTGGTISVRRGYLG